MAVIEPSAVFADVLSIHAGREFVRVVVWQHAFVPGNTEPDGAHRAADIVLSLTSARWLAEHLASTVEQCVTLPAERGPRADASPG